MLATVWQNMKIEKLRGVDAERIAADWRCVGAMALEPAPFQSADFALPILAQDQSAEVLTIRSEGRLLMAIATQSQRGLQSSATSSLTASGLPQVKGYATDAILMAFLNSLQSPFLFRALPTGSAFFGHLEKTAPHLRVLKSWQRAALNINGTFEQWQADNFDHKRRKEFKRLRTRLSERGELKLETLNHSSDLNGFVDDLLELEAKGWKGTRGTAMKDDEASAGTFREICINLHRSGVLRFWTLKFKGKPIASLFGMVEGTQGWIVKIAYDETFAKYSPGVLLILDATQAFFAEPNLKLVDSCAIPGHPMIDRIWRDRIEMVDVLVAPAQISRLKFSATVAALNTHAKLREVAKSIFYRITKRKRS
ncbi:MAG: GNAT family N-acetyltransferase [Aestuariivirga sp.]